MSGWARRLDRRVLPERRYDARQPLWVAFGGPATAVVTMTVLALARSTAGVLRVLLVLLGVAVVVPFVVAMRRWDRRHRVRP